MTSFWRRILGIRGKEPEKGLSGYGVDYIGVSELMHFNRNLLEARKHEAQGIEFYSKFLQEANDDRGREMYRRLIEEEKRHLRMIEEEIEEHKKKGYWS